MDININDSVSVTLTKYGAEVWNAWESRFENLSYTTPKYKQAGDVLKEQLWHLFQVFGGDSLYLGGHVPFDQCIISLEK